MLANGMADNELEDVIFCEGVRAVQGTLLLYAQHS